MNQITFYNNKLNVQIFSIKEHMRDFVIELVHCFEILSFKI